MKILVFGNTLISKDNLPVKLIPILKKTFPKIQFIHIDPTENLASHLDENKNLIIIDTVQNTSQAQIITLKTEQNFEKLILPKSLSMHDFDLAYNLRLLKKINQINQVKIICIPQNLTQAKIHKMYNIYDILNKLF